MRFQAIRGTEDILPPQTRLWQVLETRIRDVFSLYNYQEIRTPILEELSLFRGSIGETTDIVEKEMYTFKDKGEREICLRPEATASCIRAYLEHNLDKAGGLVKFYYLGPMFRSERPQAGRLRQFHQVGVEAVGSYEPLLDAEVINLCVFLLKEIGVSRFALRLNTLGCQEDKTEISHKYRELLDRNRDLLCEDCRRRIEKNVLRVLDCKNKQCQQVVSKLPQTQVLICNACQDHFQQLKFYLDEIGISYEFSPYLVRGLDYYTRTVFEVVSPDLGAQDAIGAGGRYDSLVESFGGPARGAIGFALGMERILLCLEETDKLEEERELCDIFIVTTKETVRIQGFKLLKELREKGFSADMDYTQKSLKAQMRLADKLQVRSVIIIGEEELEKGIFTLRDMRRSQQTLVKQSDLIDILSKKYQNEV